MKEELSEHKTPRARESSTKQKGEVKIEEPKGHTMPDKPKFRFPKVVTAKVKIKKSEESDAPYKQKSPEVAVKVEKEPGVYGPPDKHMFLGGVTGMLAEQEPGQFERLHMERLREEKLREEKLWEEKLREEKQREVKQQQKEQPEQQQKSKGAAGDAAKGAVEAVAKGTAEAAVRGAAKGAAEAVAKGTVRSAAKDQKGAPGDAAKGAAEAAAKGAAGAAAKDQKGGFLGQWLLPDNYCLRKRDHGMLAEAQCCC